jgi:prevent-host-death family protein
MPKTVTASEAKNRLGAIIRWVVQNHDTVVVENRGEPKVVVMSASDYQEIGAIKEQVRRRQVLARLERLRAEIGRRSPDLSPDEAERLADRLVRDVIEDLVQEGKIRFSA